MISTALGRALTESVVILTGIVLGEVFNRILAELYFERGSRRKHFRRRNTDGESQRSRPTRFQKFFRNQFDQKFTIACVVFPVAYVLAAGFDSAKLTKGLLPVAACWWFFQSCRWIRFLSKHDLERLRADQPHQFGEGLALNYYCGLLKFVLYKATSKFQIVAAIEKYSDEHDVEFATKDLLLLVPTSCKFPNAGDVSESERLRPLKEALILPIPIEFLQIVKKPNFTLTVHEVKKNDGKSLFVVYDFPNALKTGMGHLDDQPGLRLKNLADFRRFLEMKMFPNFQRSHQTADLPIKFIQFNDEGWSPEEYMDRVADEIVNFLDDSSLSEVISSDDCSD